MSLVTLAYACQFFISSFKPITSIHHTSIDIEIKMYAMQANICKCTFKFTIQVYELAPPICMLKILIDPLPLSYIISPPLFLCCLLTIFVHYFSPFVINNHKGLMQIGVTLNYRYVGVKPCEMRIIFPIWFNLDYLQKIFNSI